jgi:AcrR family transcriptional regulator
MVQDEKNTEHKILEAAKDVFLKKGMAGARMQEIADEAGINKSLLHYYYRSKEKLFLAVFQFAIRRFVPGVQQIILSERPIEEKITLFVKDYIDVLLEHPFVPLFIIQEIQRDPDTLFNTFINAGIEPEKILQELNEAMERGDIKKIDPRELMINVLSLCIFPFASKPVMQRVFFDNNPDEYNRFLEKRKETASEFIVNAIKK